MAGLRLEEDGAPKAEGLTGDPGVALAAAAGGLDFGGPDGGDFAGFAGKVLGGSCLGHEMNPAPEGVAGRKEGVDEGGCEGVGGRGAR